MTGWIEDTEGWESVKNTDWYKEKQHIKWTEIENNIFTCNYCKHSFSIISDDNSIKQTKYCPYCGKKKYHIYEE